MVHNAAVKRPADTNKALNSVLFNSLQAHLAILDKEGFILDTNEAWQSFDTSKVAIARPEIGTNFLATLQKAVKRGNDYALQLFIGMNKVLEGSKNSFSLSYPLQINGNTFWFKLAFRPYNEEKTQFVMIHEEISALQEQENPGKTERFHNFDNISQRKKERKELLANKQFMEAALNNNPGIFFVLNKSGDLVPWSNQFISSLGYSSELLYNKNVVDFVTEDQIEKVKSKVKDCLKTGRQSFETNLLTRDNQIRNYHIQADRFEQDGKVYIVGSGTDITEKKNAENQNKKSQLMLQQLFDNAPIGLAILDTEDNIQQVNKSFEDIFDYTQQEVVGKNINELIVPVDKEDEAKKISAATHKGDNLQVESVRRTKDNREIPVLIGGIPVEYKNEVVSIYGMYVDISEQSEYQQKIEQALREKELLLAELHHRVKNNLALINSLLDLQLFETDDQQLQRNLSDVKNRIMTIASTHEVLYQNGRLNEIPVHKFIQELIDSGSLSNGDQVKNITIDSDSEEFSLNIDQSIPCGLLLNELLSLIFTISKQDDEIDLNIALNQSGSTIHLIIEGNRLIKNPESLEEHQLLQNTLIDTLVTQLEGRLIWPNADSNNQKFELVFEKSANGHGPARHLLDN